jgi:hypothetical protein
MKVFVLVALFTVLVMAGALAQQPQASPNDEKQAALPAASGSPEPQAAPELLPDSTTLPAAPAELRLPAPINLLNPESATRGAPAPKVQLSPVELAKMQARLVELRVVAERMPRAVYLLKLANGAMTDEAKREFMRAYHYTVCTEMRRLDPRISPAINDYERTQIRRLAQGPSRLVVVSRKFLRGDRQHRIKSTDR